MLLVSRIAKLPSGLGGGYVNAGTETNEQLIVWERFQDKILIKVKSYNAVANDSLPINISVKANNYEPTLYARNHDQDLNDEEKSILHNLEKTDKVKQLIQYMYQKMNLNKVFGILHTERKKKEKKEKKTQHVHDMKFIFSICF